jgi:hypothetical protein
MAAPGMIFVYALVSIGFAEPQTNSPTPATRPVMHFDGIFRASRVKGVEEAYLKKLFRSSHAANLVKLKNGDLLCFWFSGTREGGPT